MSYTIFHYPNCGTCKKARKWLEEQGIKPVERHIVDNPPTRDELVQLIAQSGLRPQKIFNTSGQLYRELQIKEKLPGMSDEEVIQLLASDGKLIKRPILTNGRQALFGFKEEEYKQILGK